MHLHTLKLYVIVILTAIEGHTHMQYAQAMPRFSLLHPPRYTVLNVTEFWESKGLTSIFCVMSEYFELSESPCC